MHAVHAGPDNEYLCTFIVKLAVKVGCEVGGCFGRAGSALRKRDILGNKQPGYFVVFDYRFLLCE